MAKEEERATKKVAKKTTKKVAKKTTKKVAKKTTKKVSKKVVAKPEDKVDKKTTKKSTKKVTKKITKKVAKKVSTPRVAENSIAMAAAQSASSEKKVGKKKTAKKSSKKVAKTTVKKTTSRKASDASTTVITDSNVKVFPKSSVDGKLSAAKIENKNPASRNIPQPTKELPSTEKPQTQGEVSQSTDEKSGEQAKNPNRRKRGRRGGRNRRKKNPNQTETQQNSQNATSVDAKEVEAPKRRMLMNVIDAGEVRVAIVGPNGLEDVYIEKSGGSFMHGNIFKGKVDNVEANLQAAFVDIGSSRNGFLHERDVIAPSGGYSDILKHSSRKKAKNPRNPAINEMLQKGQDLLVQITREAVSSKGPSLTTYISLPGRYLVLMPAVKKRGVSKKITDIKERNELRKALDQLKPPKDMGFIIRTAGMGKGKEELQRDLDYLTRLWDSICEQAKKGKSPISIYQESDLVIRAIRDYFADDIDELLIDSQAEFERADEFLKLAMPEAQGRAKVYKSDTPLFSEYGAEEEINKLFSRSVRLESGGELIIEQTEAMVTIDVNTGKFLKGKSTREMILKINNEAAVEIARQLRLRDLGGLIMIDFIDMLSAEDRRAVESKLKESMQIDRARVTMLPISALGVMEMTRQRVRQSLRLTHFSNCPHCGGTGQVKKLAALKVDFARALRAKLQEGMRDIKVTLHPITALELANLTRKMIGALEEEFLATVTIVSDGTYKIDEYLISKKAK